MDLEQLSHHVWESRTNRASGQDSRLFEAPDGFTPAQVVEELTRFGGRPRRLVAEGVPVPGLGERGGLPLVDAMDAFRLAPYTLTGWDYYDWWTGCAELSQDGPVVVVVTPRTAPDLADAPPGATWARQLAFLTGWDQDPPGTPVDWAAVEKDLGTRLPGDYKETVDLLGPGSFDLYVDVIGPRSDDTDGGLRAWADLDARHAPSLWDPYPAFPAPGGLLRWGTSEQELDFVWLTGDHGSEGPDDPDDWVVMVREAGGEWETYPYGFGEFLVRALTDRRLGYPTSSRIGAHTFF